MKSPSAEIASMAEMQRSSKSLKWGLATLILITFSLKQPFEIYLIFGPGYTAIFILACILFMFFIKQTSTI